MAVVITQLICNKIKKINHRRIKMSRIHFEKLTPKQDVDLNIYNEALDYVFKNSDITNVAISGSYSSGKSSVIKSYKINHKEYKFLHILLASFETTVSAQKKDDETDHNSTTNENTKIEEPALEGKILNQLLHQINPSRIPQTNFRVKKNISEKSIIKVAAFIWIFIICLLHILFFDKWELLVSELIQIKYLSFLDLTTSAVSLLMSGICLIGVTGYFIFSVMKIQKNKNLFKRFSVQGNEIEIFEKSDESYFDKYLNEVLYLFDNSGADVIVFEDMDRYNVNEIFQRLREVNTLVNVKRIKENRIPLRFFYLLRDDIFVSKDRTKFFDFMIPVIPVIDSSNSYDQFIEHFKRGGIFNKLDNQFLQRIALYVDDMRILKNIYNEFMIYYSRIGTTDQDHNKLLAMIVYKNIFPRDFAETQLNNGFVFTVINSKEDIIDSEIDDINNHINELKNKIEVCNKEHLEKVEELGKIYYITYYGGSGYIDTSNPDYIRRKEIVSLIENKRIDELKNKISQLEFEKAEIRNKKIHQLISRENEKQVFSISYSDFMGNENDFYEVKTSEYFDLIKYLIRDGYIDETYEDYMTYFYPNSLTANDKKFVRSVTDKKAKEWDYKVDNPKLVISMLREVDFRELETLNFSLLYYLCSGSQENKNKLIQLIKQLRYGKYFKFIQSYLEQSPNIISVVKNINHYWSEFLSEIIQRTEFSYEEIKNYILTTLYYCSKEDIDKINQEGFLSNYISDDADFLNIENPQIEHLIKEFIRLEIEFKTINYAEVHKDFFEAIYRKRLYQFSYENIVLMLSTIYNIEDLDRIKHQNYSLIMKSSDSKLAEYVLDEIDSYITLYLDNCHNEVSDEMDDALKLINNADITLSKREKYIQYLTTNLKDIVRIGNTNFWPLVLEKCLVDYNEENILEYYFNSDEGLDDNLVSFINSNMNYKLNFSVQDIEDNFGKEKSEEFFNDLIVSNNMYTQKYQEIIESIGYRFNDFTSTDISEEKIKVLVLLEIVKMTTVNVEFMRNNYNSIFIYFVENNIEEYTETLRDSSPLTHEEILELLNRNINDEFKISLLHQTSMPISVFNENYSDTVKEHIIRHNFDTDDFEELVNEYISYDGMIQLAIFDLCIKSIEDVIDSELHLPDELFILLISEDTLYKKYKINILSNAIERISKEKFKKYVEIIKCEEYSKIFLNTGRLPRVEINDYNERLLDKLKERDWIYDYIQEDNMYKIERVTKGRRVGLSTELL